MTGNFNLYIGKAGHLAVMSEFLMRGWNVATPEVDIGDDIFVVEDESGTMKRVQVKSSSAKIRKDSFSSREVDGLYGVSKFGKANILPHI